MGTVGQELWGFDRGVRELTGESGTGVDGSVHDSISPSRPRLEALSSEGDWDTDQGSGHDNPVHCLTKRNNDTGRLILVHASRIYPALSIVFPSHQCLQRIPCHN